MKASKILLNIASVVCFIYGALYIFSLVFIPIGVYCFIAGKRFSYKAEHLYDIYTVSNKTLKNYTIFASIACFPLGLISIIPCYLLISNKVKVKGFTVTSGDVHEVDKTEQIESYADVEVVDAEKSSVDEEKEKVETIVPEEHVETEEEKLEKFEKLKNFKEKGIISEEELEMAREQLFGKKED